MLKLSGTLGKSLAALTVLGAAVFAANADLSGEAFHITASNGNGSASYDAPLSDLTYDQGSNTYSWSLTAPVDLTNDNGDVIATLNSANVYIAGDPATNWGFAVQAGSSDTTFSISSAVISFGAIQHPQGQAGAAFTITDVNHDGATLSTGKTGKAYNATYNGSTTFADLVSGFSANSGNSKSSSENEPPSGFDNIGTPVTSIQSSAYFTLTANDLASGTNGFEVIPEPSTLALVALGALSMFRRR